MGTVSDFRSLQQEMDALRGRAARFRRVALHIHSPDSLEWPKSCSGDAFDATLNDRARFSGENGPLQFYQYLDGKMDLGAITDHMKQDFGHEVSVVSKEDGGTVVLPGMEVNFALDGIHDLLTAHLVVVMPKNTGPEIFGRLFDNQPHILEAKYRKGDEVVKGLTLREWVQRVHDNGGICIAAHVDGSNGVRFVFRQSSREVMKLWSSDPRASEAEHDIPGQLLEYLVDSGLNAIEVAGFKDRPHYRWVALKDGRIRSLATLRTFDAHCLEELGRIDRLTHIKMTDIGFEGLREALKFPDTRIRFHEDLPANPLPFVRGLQIKGGLGSFFKSVTLGFAENMNCLIGARGSGKSTLVEALRYVFGYNRTLDRIDKGVAQQVEKLQGAVLTDSTIRVVYRTERCEDLVLEATYDQKSTYATRVYSVDGHMVPIEDVEACGRFPLRLFGWSEIEYLGRMPSRQRDLLDLLTPEIKVAVQQRDKAKAELVANRTEIEKVVKELNTALNAGQGEIRRFKEYQDDFARLDTAAVKGLFKNLDAERAKRKVIAILLARAADFAQDFLAAGAEPDEEGSLSVRPAEKRPLVSFSLSGDVEESLRNDDNLREWWTRVVETALELRKVEASVRSLLSRAGGLVSDVKNAGDSIAASVDEAIVALESELRENVAEDADLQRTTDLRKNAQDRLARAQRLRQAYLEKWEKLVLLQKERGKIVERFAAAQQEISAIRGRHCTKNQSTLNELLLDTMRIDIEITPGADTEEYAIAVEPFLKTASRYKFRGLGEAVAKKWSALQFASMLKSRGLLNPGIPDEPLREDDRRKITDDTLPYHQDIAACVCVLDDEGKRLLRLLELQECTQDDAVRILLNGQPVDKVSPGQRSSAMLPLIALAESTPLVIDQPEDNLDKRLIGQVLAKVLARLKERRQIIVCTHDPNFVVGGDAEQVIVLEPIGHSEGQVAANGHGAVDTPAIIQTIVDLLEGGKEAFEARETRYGRVGVGVFSK